MLTTPSGGNAREEIAIPDNSVNILLVDDRPENLLALEAVLGDLGETLVRAGSGEEALRRVLEGDYAVILLDVNMPGVSGFEVAKLVRNRQRTRHTPIIFLTAGASDDFPLEEAYALGAVDYLVKPFASVALRAKVGVFVELARRTREAREAERRLAWRTTLASIGDGVIVTDPVGRVTFLNPVAEALTGWPTADARGRPLTEVFRIVNEASRREVENPALRALETGFIVGLANHTVLIARDGAERPIDDSASPIRTEDGTLTGAVLVFRDISERRKAEVAQARLAAIVESSEDAIIGKSLDGVIQSWNAGAERVFGYTAAEAVGQPITILIPPDRLDEEGRILEKVRRGERVEHFETARLTKSGRPLDISLTVSPIRDLEGHIIGASKVARDVTDRKRAEQERERLVGELREQDRRKDEFLATLAHELRNPLAPIRNGLQVMKLAGGDGPAVERSRAMMERQVEQMTHLINDLMDVSRISRGKVALQRQRMRLSVAVGDAVETSRPLIERRGHEFILDVPDEPIVVDADVTRLTQVFANLLNNAAKYTEPGGRIRLSVRREGGEAVFQVEDTGVGIPADMQPRVFDMFAQVDRSLEKAEGGLGIGLHIVKRLVEMHGGTVTAASGGHGLGSAFTVRLPVVLSPTSDRAAPDDRAQAVPAARRRILVVDDNRDGAASLAEMLAVMGHQTQTASDGLEAITAAEAFRPDVILMDIGMPRLNGYDACRRIREQLWGKNIVIVAQTGWGQDEDVKKSQEAGFDFHLVKPVDPAALERLLAETQEANRLPPLPAE